MSFLNLFSGSSKKSAHSTPPDTRIYAIGDIHGNLPPLKKLHEEITRKERNLPDVKRRVMLYLGDYVDRGMESKQVIEYLINAGHPSFENVFLRGNHEYIMLKFMDYPEESQAWLLWGGDSTIQSYGVKFDDSHLTPEGLRVAAQGLKEKVPASHIKFLNDLKLSHTEGDYFFVHAGLKPGVEILKQSEEDMLMIRDEFIMSNKKFGKTVVFGHTIFEKPFVAPEKIGVDTGSYASGKLTAVMLEGEKVEFISTK